MDVIVCLDDRNGMLFHGRRQSRDRKVIEDIQVHLEGKRFCILPFSQKLFSPGDAVIINGLDSAGPGDLCFVEDRPLSPYFSQIQRLIIYRWNRHYPGDLFFDIDVSQEGTLVSREEFPGYSHEKITKEIYRL